MICKATIHDIKPIYYLLQQFAEKGELLPRPLSFLYDHVRDFTVYKEDPSGPIIGCCAAQICWEDLAEIRSLAVMASHWNQGIGSKLVRAAIDEVRALGIKTIFVLTYRPWFFEKHQFKVIDKSSLPQKVWADCLHCIKFPDCDEVALIRDL